MLSGPLWIRPCIESDHVDGHPGLPFGSRATMTLLEMNPSLLKGVLLSLWTKKDRWRSSFIPDVLMQSLAILKSKGSFRL